MLKRIFALLFVIAIIGVVGCSENPTGSSEITDNASYRPDGTIDNMNDADIMSETGSHLFRWGRHRGEPMTFVVRIENVSTTSTLMLSNGETAPAPHSPGVWIITRAFNPLFKIGRYDQGLGLEQQAEDGDPSMLAESMANKRYVRSSGVFNTPVGDAGPGPALPGKAYEFTVTARPGDRLSFTSMFGQSNDLFYSPGFFGIPLFNRWGQPVDGDVTRFVRLWDAGTEVNQEPGLGADQAPRQSGPNTGESEHKRVWYVHDQYTYPRTNEVIKVTIMPAEPVS